MLFDESVFEEIEGGLEGFRKLCNLPAIYTKKIIDFTL